VSAITPDRAPRGTAAPTITVMGNGFYPRSYVELDGVKVTTSFVHDEELKVTLPAGIMAASGAKKITVLTSAPGGGRSNAVDFLVTNPTPTMASLKPNNAQVGSSSVALTIEGTGFVAGAKVKFGADEISATIASPTSLGVTVPGAKLASSGSVPVTVVNPTPGGGESTPIAFTVTNPTVTVSSVTPSSIAVGSPQNSITVRGSGFVSASRVSFNGNPIVTRYVSSEQLSADVPASALTATGDFPVVVTNPAPGGGVSAPVIFRVVNPTPGITTLNPSSATAGAAPVTVRVLGTSFVPQSVVRFDGVTAATTFVSGAELRATLSAAQLANARYIAVTVVNPTPGGGTSLGSTFTVNNPTPDVTSLTPATLTKGSADTTISVYGTNFVATSVAQADGADLATTFVDKTQVRAVVPAAKLASASTVQIRVRNPAPGASTSGTRPLTVSDPMACDTTGVDQVLGAVGSPKTVALAYSKGPDERFYFDPDDPGAFTCPVTKLSVTQQSYATIVVQNTSGSAKSLSVNAVCTGTDDAFMTVYAGRPTAPVTDDERKQCTGYVANGSGGAGARASTQSNGSSFCPGLTKANGGGVVLNACDKAVILVIPYSYPAYARPASVVVDLEN
jgi:hypothetical protein